MDFVTELVPDTQIVILQCPIKRLMNTQDYDDAKLEIGLFYRMKGFYTIIGPNSAAGAQGQMVYGNGEEILIEILDYGMMGTHFLPLLFVIVSCLMFI